MLEKVDRILTSHGNDKASLIGILQDIQAEYNYLPPKPLERVAEKVDAPLSQVLGIATFFQSFSLKPRGEHIITVCTGTACHVKGAPRVLGAIERELGIKPGDDDTTEGLGFTVEAVNCLGSCALAPLVVVDGKYQGHVTGKKMQSLINKTQKSKKK